MILKPALVWTLLWSAAVGASASESLTCKRPILAEFLFNGIPTPEFQMPLVCQATRYSCCSPADQMAVFEDYIFSGTHSHIEARFNFYRRVYYAAMDEAERTKKLAQLMLQHIFPKKLMNCRVMAARIIAHDIEAVNDELTRHIDGFYNYLLQSYKGLYCSACDARVHQDLNIDAKVFEFSEGYCRDFVAHAFQFLDYFHVKMVPFFNLLTKFMGSCHGDGEFDEYFIPPVSRFEEDKETHDMMGRCGSFVHDKTWLIHCQPICEKFDFFQWNDFYSPNLGKLIQLTLFLEEKRHQIVASEPKLRIALAEGEIEFDIGIDERRRIGLNDSTPVNATGLFEINAATLASYTADTSMLNPPSNSYIRITEWKPMFVEGGFDLYEHGSQTDLDMLKFKSLQNKYPHYRRCAGRLAAVVGALICLVLSMW